MQSQFTSSNLKNFNYYEFADHLSGKITLAEYIWLDGTGKKLRSKTKVYNHVITKLEELEDWNYDGSSCEQANTQKSEIILKPVFMCKDPIRKKNSILVLCETYCADQVTPARYNFRYLAKQIMEDAKDEDPWFGIEQEFFLFVRCGTTSTWPLGWPEGGFPYPQGRYYCGIGDENAFGRAVIEAALRCFLDAGLTISGINGEVAPGQWEYQVGITKGIECGDHMLMSRYILARIGEEFGCTIDLEPKPIQGDWNGSGCHTNFSTNSTRKENGLQYIVDHCMPKLESKHKEHIALYGEGNFKRLTGQHETASIDKFNHGFGNRGCSVRIPTYTLNLGKGYFEDRRPASNIDPYLVSGSIVDTVCLNSKYMDQLLQAYRDALDNNF